jgi:hypothetical protein
MGRGKGPRPSQGLIIFPFGRSLNIEAPMPYFAVFGTPLSDPFRLDGSEYSAELDAGNDNDAMAEAERHFQPHLLALHWYPTRDRVPAEFRLVVDYEELAREAFNE